MVLNSKACGVQERSPPSNIHIYFFNFRQRKCSSLNIFFRLKIIWNVSNLFCRSFSRKCPKTESFNHLQLFATPAGKMYFTCRRGLCLPVRPNKEPPLAPQCYKAAVFEGFQRVLESGAAWIRETPVSRTAVRLITVVILVWPTQMSLP